MNSAVTDILKFLKEHDYVLFYGLAPNPFGFSFLYEGPGKRKKALDKKLDRMLSDLTASREADLRKRYFN